MKTTADLNALIPTIVEGIKKSNPEYGDGYPEHNSYEYMEDGWTIQVYFICEGWYCGSDSLSHGECDVQEIYALWEDEDSDDYVEFGADDTKKLASEIEFSLLV